MERVWKPVRVAVAVMMILAGQTAAQAQVADTTATAIQLDARIDSLAVQLRQAQEAIEQQRALIDVLIQTQSQPAPSPPQGMPAVGRLVAPTAGI
ncbi:MAG: hypothetical protein QGI34_13670 [Candidatus Latescibacteria bacterium]|nr:hypothetical protein [Candidatus Latescibacterota bacterium]